MEYKTCMNWLKFPAGKEEINQEEVQRKNPSYDSNLALGICHKVSPLGFPTKGFQSRSLTESNSITFIVPTTLPAYSRQEEILKEIHTNSDIPNNTRISLYQSRIPGATSHNIKE